MSTDSIRDILINKYEWGSVQIELGLRANFKCEYCNRDLLGSIEDYDSWQIDHIIPKSKNGPDDFPNYAISCKLCNFIKRNWQPPGIPYDRQIFITAIRKYILEKRESKQKRLSEMRKLIEQLIVEKNQ